MEVKLFANLAETADARSIELEVEEETTVGTALGRLFERRPGLESEVLVDERVHDHISILINGRTLDPDDALEEPVGPEDELAIFPPVSGGVA